jgi:Fic family protein
VVDTRDSVVLHTPPNASELEKRVDKLCRFANEMDGDTFIHPVVRAIILHFAIGYDHPFVDGNGRTARAVFYWSMLSRGYWLTEYISISRILKGAPSEYARAYLYTETDENDVTYFIIHQLNVILRAIQDLQKYLTKKSTEVHEIEAMIRKSPRLRGLLNHRQIALLGHALRHPGTVYRIEGHRQSHKVTYDTARTDLLKLARLKLLEKQRTGRAFVFLSPPNLAARLRQANTK